MDVPVLFLGRRVHAASTGVMMTNEDICSGFERPCATRCPNAVACPSHFVVLVKSELVSQCKNGYDKKSAGCSRRFQFILINFCLIVLAVCVMGAKIFLNPYAHPSAFS